MNKTYRIKPLEWIECNYANTTRVIHEARVPGIKNGVLFSINVWPNEKTPLLEIFLSDSESIEKPTLIACEGAIRPIASVEEAKALAQSWLENYLSAILEEVK